MVSIKVEVLLHDADRGACVRSGIAPGGLVYAKRSRGLDAVAQHRNASLRQGSSRIFEQECVVSQVRREAGANEKRICHS